jgi:hypothetical protein
MNQYSWILHRKKAGGRAFVILQIEKEYFAIDDEGALRDLCENKVTYDELKGRCAVWATGAPRFMQRMVAWYDKQIST